MATSSRKSLVSGVLSGALLLAACGAEPQSVEVAKRLEQDAIATQATPPTEDDPSACYGVDATPAVIQTVTEQVLLRPAETADDGSVQYRPVYKTETRQAIVEERREIWFETPCETDLTPDFVASLQRALKVRGYYDGAVTGELTSTTGRAIRAYQKPRGLDSAILSMEAARQLGLAAYPAAS